jgi:gliding motility-associated-like protein
LYMRNLYKLTVIIFFSMCAKAQVAPNASIVSTNSLLCTSVPVTFSALSTGNSLSYTWAVVPAKGLSSYSDLNSPTVSLTFTNASTYTIFLNVSDNSALTRITYTTITLSRSPIASFNASFSSVGFPTQLILTNYSSYGLKSYWQFNDSAEPDSSLNIVKNYTVSGSYTVTLFIEGPKGCNATSTYDFRISDSSGVTLPNIFTPNGDDINDVYRPVTRGINSLSAWVYDRQGALVCMWDQVRGAWDGYTTSGEECSEGVYFVVVEASGFDGRQYKIKSTITLMR